MFLDPTLDVVFKLMLTTQPESTEVLIDLIEAVLQPSTPIVSVIVINPELPKSTIRDKGIRLDVAVTLHDGRLLDLEMQTSRRRGFRDRALYYLARLFARDLKQGQEYVELRSAVSVLFLDYIELETPKWHTTFQLLEANPHDSTRQTQLCWSYRIALHVIELPKARGAVTMEPKLSGWVSFFKATTAQERKAVCMSNPTMTKAQNILDRLGEDPHAQRLAQERLDEEYFWHLDRKLDLDHARAEAGSEGEARGVAKGIVIGEICAYSKSAGVEVTELQQAELVRMELPALIALREELQKQR